MDHILRSHEIIDAGFVRGENCCLYDSSGRCFIDFEAGIWAASLGHSHPRLKAVLHRQVDQLIHLGSRYPSPLAEHAAQDVLSLTGMQDGKCVFLCSGSEAVEFGVQAARRVTGRPLVLTFADSYLAAFGSAGKKNPTEWLLFDWFPCADCASPADCENCPSILSLPFDQLAGFVFEPGSSSGFVRFPPSPVVETIARRVQQSGGLLVANEITTGMGRTGRWWGHQHYDIQPDIVASGKGLGAGYPVSAAALSSSVARRLEDSGLRYAQSHQNDPLGCAVASEVIAVMREDRLIERSQHLGEGLLACLQELVARRPLVKAVRGRGLMLAVEFHPRGDPSPAALVHRALFERGLLVGCSPSGNYLRINPALTIEESQLSLLVRNLDDVLTTLEEGHE